MEIYPIRRYPIDVPKLSDLFPIVPSVVVQRTPLDIALSKITSQSLAADLARDIISRAHDVELERERTKRYGFEVDLDKVRVSCDTQIRVAEIYAHRDIRVAQIQAHATVEVGKFNAAMSVMNTALQCGVMGSGYSEADIEETPPSFWTGKRTWKLKLK